MGMFQLLLHPRLSVCSTGITVTPWDCKLLLRLPVVVEPTSHLECVESPPFLRARTHRKQISPSGCPPPWAMGTTVTALPPQACVESGQIPEAAKTGTTSPNLMVGPEEPHPHSSTLSPARERECSRQAPRGRANRRSAATHIREGEARGARGQPQRLQRTAWRSSTFRRAKWTLAPPSVYLPSSSRTVDPHSMARAAAAGSASRRWRRWASFNVSSRKHRRRRRPLL